MRGRRTSRGKIRSALQPSTGHAEISRLRQPLKPPKCLACQVRRRVCDLAKPACEACRQSSQCCHWTGVLGPHVFEMFPTHYNLNGKLKPPKDDIVDIAIESGSFGSVTRCELIDGGLVAVKTPRQRKDVEHNRLLLLCLREALTWSELDHPNIARLRGITNDFGPRLLSLVSEWMPNGHIMGYLKNRPDVSRLNLLWDIAKGVQYLHGLNIVHGDLKGNNVLISNDGEALLTDFGLSYVRDDHVDDPETSGAWTANARWAAPERIRPDLYKATDHPNRTMEGDIFSMCRTFLEVLTGEVPFREEPNNFAVINLVTDNVHPNYPSAMIYGTFDQHIGEALDKRLWGLMLHGWDEDPAKRMRASDMEVRMRFLTWNRLRMGADWANPAAWTFWEELSASIGTPLFDAVPLRTRTPGVPRSAFWTSRTSRLAAIQHSRSVEGAGAFDIGTIRAKDYANYTKEITGPRLSNLYQAFGETPDERDKMMILQLVRQYWSLSALYKSHRTYSCFKASGLSGQTLHPFGFHKWAPCCGRHKAEHRAEVFCHKLADTLRVSTTCALPRETISLLAFLHSSFWPAGLTTPIFYHITSGHFTLPENVAAALRLAQGDRSTTGLSLSLPAVCHLMMSTNSRRIFDASVTFIESTMQAIRRSCSLADGLSGLLFDKSSGILTTVVTALQRKEVLDASTRERLRNTLCYFLASPLGTRLDDCAPDHSDISFSSRDLLKCLVLCTQWDEEWTMRRPNASDNPDIMNPALLRALMGFFNAGCVACSPDIFLGLLRRLVQFSGAADRAMILNCGIFRSMETYFPKYARVDDDESNMALAIAAAQAYVAKGRKPVAPSPLIPFALSSSSWVRTVGRKQVVECQSASSSSPPEPEEPTSRTVTSLRVAPGVDTLGFPFLLDPSTGMTSQGLYDVPLASESQAFGAFSSHQVYNPLSSSIWG